MVGKGAKVEEVEGEEMELLELEMRARAIKALLKKEEDRLGEGEQDDLASPLCATITDDTARPICDPDPPAPKKLSSSTPPLSSSSSSSRSVPGVGEGHSNANGVVGQVEEDRSRSRFSHPPPPTRYHHHHHQQQHRHAGDYHHRGGPYNQQRQYHPRPNYRTATNYYNYQNRHFQNHHHQQQPHYEFNHHRRHHQSDQTVYRNRRADQPPKSPYSNSSAMSKQTRGNSEADQRRQRPSPFLSPPRHMPNSDSIAIDLNHHHRQVEEDKKKKHDESHEDQLLPGREESEDFLDIELGEEYDIGYDY